MISNFKLWMVNGCKRISYSGCNIISFLIDSDNMGIHFDNSGDAKKCPELNSYSMVLNFPLGNLCHKMVQPFQTYESHISIIAEIQINSNL